MAGLPAERDLPPRCLNKQRTSRGMLQTAQRSREQPEVSNAVVFSAAQLSGHLQLAVGQTG
jgi:hypothetical protein